MKFTEANKDKNEAKFRFQGQSARSQSWFDIGIYWIEEFVSTRKADFYRIIIHKIQIHLKCFKFQQKFKMCGNF